MEHRKFARRLDELLAELTHAQALPPVRPRAECACFPADTPPASRCVSISWARESTGRNVPPSMLMFPA